MRRDENSRVGTTYRHKRQDDSLLRRDWHPARAENNYREYGEQDMSRLRLVAGARRLDLSLDDIQEIIALRDHREAPCRIMLERLAQKADEIAERIQALQRLEGELRELHALGLTFPTDDVEGKHCVCHLVSEHIKE